MKNIPEELTACLEVFGVKAKTCKTDDTPLYATASEVHSFRSLPRGSFVITRPQLPFGLKDFAFDRTRIFSQYDLGGNPLGWVNSGGSKTWSKFIRETEMETSPGLMVNPPVIQKGLRVDY